MGEGSKEEAWLAVVLCTPLMIFIVIMMIGTAFFGWE